MDFVSLPFSSNRDSSKGDTPSHTVPQRLSPFKTNFNRVDMNCHILTIKILVHFFRKGGPLP
jgi:hypothetical protein